VVAEKCWGLEVLDLSESARVGRRALIILRKRLMMTLRALSLARCVSVGADHLHALLGGVPAVGQLPRAQGHNLAELDLSDCPLLRGRAFAQALGYSQPMGAALRCLSLDNMSGLGDKCVAQIAKSCPNLLMLRLAHSPLVTDYSAVVLFQYLKQLSVLSLDSCSGLTPGALQLINDVYTKYQKMSAAEIQELLSPSGLPRHKKVEISMIDCPSITEEAIQGAMKVQQDQVKLLAKKHRFTKEEPYAFFKDFVIISKQDSSLVF